MLNSSTTSESLDWFCLRSQAKREHIAAANLKERVSIDVFAPRIRSMHTRRGGLSAMSTEALFPGYLFARFSYTSQMRHVMSTHGVTGIVAFGGRPPVLADSLIDCLRREVTEAGKMPVAPLLQEGAWVRILSGCFRFLEGRVLNFDPRTERVRLLLNLLGSDVQVSLTMDRVALFEEQRSVYPSGLMTQPAEPALSMRCAG